MKKRYILIFITLFLFTGLYIYWHTTRTANSEEVHVETNNTKEPDNSASSSALSWSDSHTSLCERFDIAVCKGSTVYGAYLDESGLTAIAQDIQSSDILSKTEISNVTDVQNIAADAQNNIFIMGTLDGKVCFWKIDSNNQVTVWNDLELEDSDYSQYLMPPQLKGMYADDKGHFYFWYELNVPYIEYDKNEEPDVYTLVDRIYVKNSDMETLYYENVQNSDGFMMLGFSVDQNGIPTILAQDDTEVYIRQFDAENGKDILSKPIDGIQPYKVCENMVMTEDGFLFCQGNNLYQYSFENSSCEKIINLASCGIFASDIIYFGIDNENIIIIDNYRDEKHSEYTVIQPGESDKIQLTLGTIIAQEHTDLENAVTQFNRFHDDIHIEFINYHNAGNHFDEEVERLKLDIIKGNVPDILEVSMIDWEMLAKKGLWADLYDFMEQDEEFQSEILFSNVLKAYELDGHLYSLAPSFQIHSMWGSKSIAQDQYGITFQELMQILQDNGKDLNAVYGFSADAPIQTTLCAMEMDEFIDWKNGTCDFEKDNFKDILMFAKEYESESNNVGGTLLDRIREGEILFSTGVLYSVADYQMEKELYGADLSFVGYPVQSGTGTALNFRGSQLAIHSNGENLDAAWEFVKYFLINGYDNNGFPVIKEQFDTKMLQDMEKCYVESIDGIVENSRKTYFDGISYIEVFEASQEDVDAVRELIEKADCKYQNHPEIQKIINEEAAAYFAGQKSLEEVTALIQNRVSLYLAEQM